MALISINFVFSAGAVIVASQHNSNNSTIVNVINGGLDNTNLTGSAGITYANLNVTGSIVNADLAGSIADSKLSQITTASKVSGAALTSLSSIPSGAGLIPVLNLASGTASSSTILYGDQTYKSAPTFTQVGLGVWTGATADGAAHQVTTDGFLTVEVVGDGSNIFSGQIKTDSSNPPTTVRVRFFGSNGATNKFSGGSCPVKKNDYYSITITGTGTTTNAFFVPLGS